MKNSWCNLWRLVLACAMIAGCGTSTQLEPPPAADSPAATDTAADAAADPDDAADRLPPEPEPLDAPPQEVAWHNFAWLEAGFAVEAPVNVWTNQSGDPGVEAPSTVFLARAVIPGLATLWCMTSQFRADAPALSPAERLLVAQQGAQQTMNGQLVSQRDIELAEAPGREFVMQLPNGTFALQRIYLVDSRLHQLLVEAATQDELADPRIERFLSSYQLLELPEQ